MDARYKNMFARHEIVLLQRGNNGTEAFLCGNRAIKLKPETTLVSSNSYKHDIGICRLINLTLKMKIEAIGII